jgi:hypothetical protein
MPIVQSAIQARVDDRSERVNSFSKEMQLDVRRTRIEVSARGPEADKELPSLPRPHGVEAITPQKTHMQRR